MDAMKEALCTCRLENWDLLQERAVVKDLEAFYGS